MSQMPSLMSAMPQVGGGQPQVGGGQPAMPAANPFNPQSGNQPLANPQGINALQGMGGTSAPGAQAISGGYNTAYQNLLQAFQQSQNTQSGQQAMLGQQFQNQQGQVRQGLTNSGLANSTIMQNMQQAPMQTYNMGMMNSQNQGALLQMQALQNMANMSAQGGQALAGYYSPFGLNQASFNQQQHPVQSFNPYPSAAGGGGMNNSQMMNQANMYSQGGGGGAQANTYDSSSGQSYNSMYTPSFGDGSPNIMGNVNQGNYYAG